MRTIVHLSDLHFGVILEPTLEPLIKAVAAMKPDLVVISGDLTQRARVEQFKAAQTYLNALPQPRLVLPGNHDVPLYNIVRRFAWPLERYQQFITKDLSPYYIDDEIAVLGINTARSLVLKGGRINREQINRATDQLKRLGGHRSKIVVTHHPFDLPEGLSGVEIVGSAQMAMEAFAQCGVDLFLAGHLHLIYVGSAARYQIKGYQAPVIQAGSATSTRARGEPNSFNVIRVDPGRISVAACVWSAERLDFGPGRTWNFRQGQGGWVSG